MEIIHSHMKTSSRILFFFLLVFLSACSLEQQETTSAATTDRLAEKYGPSEEFFMQRSYPDGRFSIEAYEEALHEAKEMAAARGVVPGFDTDWVTEGPGNIGARINTVAVHPTDEDIMYAGFAGGGVFKTIDGGSNWVPIFDDQIFLAISDIHLDSNNPEIVYVATGDHNISGYPKIGDGVWRSNDGGTTWEHLGLTEQRIISEIIVDPTDSDVIYAATMGLPFEKNDMRGLYKTVDGGQNWDQILFLSDSTGVIDIVMDPFDSQTLYAAGWDRIRNNFVSIVRGEGAKVYKTTDGGANWNILEGGLPNDQAHSRIGLEISKKTEGVVYVQYVRANNYQLGGIYKSEDAGTTFDTIAIHETFDLSPNALGGFGWYFGKIRIHPNDDDEVFLLGVDLWTTKNQGQFWERATPPWWQYSVHADKHDLVFTNSGNMILATDGGLYKRDLAGEWSDIENIPATQLYRVAYNPHQPQNYYGGAQDNGSMGGNKDNINDWPRIYGGDGFQMVFDPLNEQRYFAETQNGNIVVTLDDGFYWDSANEGIDPDDRRNWDMPYMMSSHSSQNLFTGTYRVYLGFGSEIPTWVPISDDLTDGTEELHRYHNITTIHESPIVSGLLYVGTGDGNVWRSDNLGDEWISISNGLIDQYVTSIIASPDDEDVVYVSFSGYRDNDNLARLHKSTDRGSSWESISSDLPDLAINDILVIPNHQDSVIFVATDGGVYGTIDYGASWNRVGGNMPSILVFDLDYNVANNEIIAGTFARSIMSISIDSLLFEEPVVSAVNTPKETLVAEVKIYPNPASGTTNIDLLDIEMGRNCEMVVLDAQGKLMLSKEIDGKRTESVDVSEWPAGNYVVKIKERHEVRVGKLLVVH